MKTKYFMVIILSFGLIGKSSTAGGLLGLLGLNLDLPLIGTPVATPKPQTQSQPGLLGLGTLPILGPLLSILPNSAGLQLPLVGNVLNTATGLLNLATTNPADLLKLNLTVSPLDLNQSSNFECPSPLGLFPDPNDCASFYVCLLNVLQLKLTCLPGNHYEPGLLVLCLPNDPKTLPERCNRCPTYTKPRNCTTSPYGCSFCIQNRNFPGKYRCDKYANLVRAGCNESQIYDRHDNNTKLNPDPDQDQINLLPGDRRNVSITFKLTSHPLDVYLLLDISGSMGDDKANVVALSSRLVNYIANLTKDYRLGFGAFSDKVDTYTYRNILPLSSDTSNFSSTVNSTKLLYGGDAPEDAGTAMYEAAVCEKEIGWRNSTRRVILLLTDATFHVAKDGSFVGKLDFDGKCHLDSSGIYTERLTQNYPSIAQIAEILGQQQITVIFGIVSGRSFYDDVATQIRPSSIGVLASDSSNIIDLFDKEYRKIASKVEMQHSKATKEIQIKYYSNCDANSTSSDRAVTEKALCEGLPLEGQVTFTVEIGLDECPKDEKDWNQNIKIGGVGLPYLVEVALRLVCGDWEK